MIPKKFSLSSTKVRLIASNSSHDKQSFKMTDPLPIIPFKQPLTGSIELPGSKSITNRTLILAALADGETRLEGALFSRDTKIMLEALKVLGFTCSADSAAQTIVVQGESGIIPNSTASINVGNAGTAARFLTALLALHPNGKYQLDGDPAMRNRPMSGLLNALQGLNAADFEFHGKPNHFPFTMKTKGYESGSVEVDASASSQILSALLLSASAGSANIELHCPDVRPSYVAITLKMRKAFGAQPIQSDRHGTYSLRASTYKTPFGGTYSIEPDLSAASYFFALTLIQGGQIKLPNIGSEPLQGDAEFADILAHHGLKVAAESDQWTVERTLALQTSNTHREIDFNAFSDTFLTYAAIAPLLGGSVKISGIGHTRMQETDRIAGMANELSRLGQLVKDDSDSLTIYAQPDELHARAFKGQAGGQLLEVETYEDHRFAMSFGVLGSFDLLGNGKPWLAIKDPGCCGKTFPEFFQELDNLHKQGS